MFGRRQGEQLENIFGIHLGTKNSKNITPHQFDVTLSKQLKTGFILGATIPHSFTEKNLYSQLCSSQSQKRC
jgi:hypothetical protein